MSRVDISSLSERHQRYVREQLAASRTGGELVMVAPASEHLSYDSKTEERFAGYLTGLPSVVEWQYHPMRLNLTPFLREPLTYTPDFGAIVRGGLYWKDFGSAEAAQRSYCLFEVKGSWQSKNARDSRTRLHVAAALFPFRWFAVNPENEGRWKIVEIERRREG